MKERKYIVYMHVNKINNKRYIGITCRKPEDRWKNGSGYINNKYFNNAIKKYGWCNFEHHILYTNLTKEEAEQKEIEFISKYKTTQLENGYNISSGGNAHTGAKHTLESRKKMSKSLKGKPSPRKGVKLSEETKRKISVNNRKYLLGKHLSEETKKKISNSNKISLIGNIPWNKNKKGYKVHTKESKKKLSEHFKSDKNVLCKKINRYNLDGSFDCSFYSIAEAERQSGINHSNIVACCSRKRKTSGGYIWRYANE